MGFWFRPLRWYDLPLIILLGPLSLLFGLLSAIRRAQYRAGQRPICTSKTPVVVVGNILVGGTGKTPATIALCKALTARQFKVAIISRGYGAQAGDFPRSVHIDDNAQNFGDEPLLMANRTQCPVVIDPERCRGIAYINQTFSPDVIISDDGLQHYAMGRQYEIVVSDRARGFGNGYLLPLGPLREPLRRLQDVNAHWINGDNEQGFMLKPSAFVNVASGERVDIDLFEPRDNIVAIAGIGHPKRFFDQLASMGFTFESSSFADHHPYQSNDFDFAGERIIIMTEKDAVKCRSLPQSQQMWYLEVDAHWDNDGLRNTVDDIASLIGEKQ